MVWPFGSEGNSKSPQPAKQQDATDIPVRPYKPNAEDQEWQELEKHLDHMRGEDEHNPFVAFRRFADEQFRLLAEGLSTVPSLLSQLEERGSSTPHTSRWSDTSFASRAHQPLAFMSQHFEPPFSPARDNGPPSAEAIEATMLMLAQSRNALPAGAVAPDRILDLFRDFETSPPAPFVRHPAAPPAWLSPSWFLTDAYSPLSCEVDPHLHRDGSKWRAAFEDLMSASLGKEMVARDAWTGARDDQSLYAAWSQSGRDWMLSLMCRGVTPPLLPALYAHRVDEADQEWRRMMDGRGSGDRVGRDFWNLVREVGWFDDEERAEQARAHIRVNLSKQSRNSERPDDGPQSEMDAYERFLGKANGRDEAVIAQSARPGDHTSLQKPGLEKSKILSTLSTTETTTLPDGTVTTKVMVKKRFADGSEQSTTSESTVLANEKDQRGSRQEVGPATKEQTQPSEKKKGWLWG